MKTTLHVSGMTCSSCVATVEKTLAEVAGVTEVHVDLAANSATVQHHSDVTLADLTAVVNRTGKYSAVPQPSGADAASDVVSQNSNKGSDESLYPLFLIVGFILGTTLLIQVASGTWDWATLGRHFMAGFFLVFSFFKLLDVPGFVDAYRGYDLLARRSVVWAWMYPFVELILGVAYLLDLAPVAVNVVTFVLMVIGAAGVLRALLAKRTIQCACLGSALSLPMTKVTLIEDLTMAIMAAMTLWIHWA